MASLAATKVLLGMSKSSLCMYPSVSGFQTNSLAFYGTSTPKSGQHADKKSSDGTGMAQNANDSIKETAESGKEKVKDAAHQTKKAASSAAEQVQSKVKEIGEKASSTADEFSRQAKEKMEQSVGDKNN